VATLRERTSGTLERLMMLPIGKIDLLAGYALAFGVFGVIEVGVVATVCITWLGLSVQGSVTLLVLIAVLDAVLGMALGLFVRTPEGFAVSASWCRQPPERDCAWP
jgi:ABC-2 type transport system permease protein